jgi:hypothetical protein
MGCQYIATHAAQPTKWFAEVGPTLVAMPDPLLAFSSPYEELLQATKHVLNISWIASLVPLIPTKQVVQVSRRDPTGISLTMYLFFLV